jgi:hypothetical protein
MGGAFPSTTPTRKLRPQQKQALRILAWHVVSQFELHHGSRELGDVRRQNEQCKGDLEKSRAQLAAARCELAQRNAKPAAAPRAKPAKRCK